MTEISRGFRAQRDTPGTIAHPRAHREAVQDNLGKPPMPSTYLSLHYHIIFSTKNREPLIATGWRNRLHEYMGGTVRSLQGIPQTIGGVDDHVHLLLGLKATHCLSDFMRDLKKRTSLWVHETIRDPRFAWQDGYAAFSISAPSRGAIVTYITNQEEHHRTMTFREELVKFLKRAAVEYDEKYLD